MPYRSWYVLSSKLRGNSKPPPSWKSITSIYSSTKLQVCFVAPIPPPSIWPLPETKSCHLQMSHPNRMAYLPKNWFSGANSLLVSGRVPTQNKTTDLKRDVISSAAADKSCKASEGLMNHQIWLVRWHLGLKVAKKYRMFPCNDWFFQWTNTRKNTVLLVNAFWVSRNCHDMMMIWNTCQFIYEMYQATVDIDISIQYIYIYPGLPPPLKQWLTQFRWLKPLGKQWWLYKHPLL